MNYLLLAFFLTTTQAGSVATHQINATYSNEALCEAAKSTVLNAAFEGATTEVIAVCTQSTTVGRNYEPNKPQDVHINLQNGTRNNGTLQPQ